MEDMPLGALGRIVEELERYYRCGYRVRVPIPQGFIATGHLSDEENRIISEMADAAHERATGHKPVRG